MLKKSLSILLALIICFGAVMVTPFTALSENASEIVEETFADDGAESVIANNTSIPESELQESDNNKSEDSVVTLANEEFINEKADLASTGAEQTYGDFKYTVSGSNATLTGYIGSGGAITIPAKINGYTVSGIGTGAFRGNKVITKLTIEAALTSMGYYAFAECTSLTSVVIKSGTTLVGYNAFGDCTSLASVSLPSMLKTIGGYAFNKCSNLSTITIPDSVTEISTYAFRSSGIKTLKLGSNVKKIGSDAFAYCNNLTTVTLPNSVSSIGDGAFSNCSSLDSVNIGNSVTEMGNYAFGWDTALTKVVIADGTKVIGKYAFATSYGNSSASKLNEVRIPASVEKIGDANSANNVFKDNSVFGTGRTVKATIYGINGSFANQFCNANAEACNLEWCNGGDTTPPTASISSTNNVASSQTVTLSMSDDFELSVYYWGTNSSTTSISWTSISGKSKTVTTTVSSGSTYYLTVKDTSGNITQKSATFYMTTLNANGGSVSPTSITTKSGNSFTFPTPTRSGYTYNGWSTSSSATSGITSLKPTGNQTYYAIWTADPSDTTKPSASISSTNNVASSQTVTLSMSDNAGLAGYYWGASSSTSPSYTSISGKSYSTDTKVSSSGTYYLTVKDTSGNVYQTSATFYKTTLNANGGSVSPTSITTKSGNSFTFPTPTRSGYTYNGWSTSSSATSGITSLKPTGNQTYYAIWTADPSDTTKPSASISSTNNVASSQTVTLSMSDNAGLAGYYWGASSSTSPSYTSISGKSYSTDTKVSSSGTYYLTVKDTSGNVYQTSATFYKTTLNANGGSVSPSYVLTMSGYSFTFPTPTRSGYTYNGWSTSSTATSGIKSLTPSGNQTYYAVWKTPTPYSITFDPSSITTSVGGYATVSINFSGEGIYTLRYEDGDSDICTAKWGSVDYSAGTTSITFTGKAAGTTTYTIHLLNSDKESIYSKSISITVTPKDVTAPVATITSTNDLASSQTVTLSMSDNVELANYRWGTESSTLYYEGNSGKSSYSTTKPVNTSGTYYLIVEDRSANRTQVSATFYKTTLNANGGSVDINSVLTMSGNSFTPPTPTRDGYIFNGWSTSSTAFSGSDSITPTGNHTYYATWRSKIPYSITFDPERVTTYVGSSVTVTVRFTGGDIKTLNSLNDDTSICTSKWGTCDYKTGLAYITFTGVKVGSTSCAIRIKNNAGVIVYGKSISINVISEPSDAIIKASNVKGVAGKTVDVPISLINNPGIIGATLGVKYNDAALELVDVTDMGALGSSSHKPEYVSPYTLSWANDTSTENYTIDGPIAILTFKIKEETAAGSYPVIISYDYDNYGIYNKDLNKVNFSIENGSVDVSAYLCGDVNSDGVVNNLDRLYLTRYLANWEDYQDINLVAADVDCSGTVNNLDRVILTRYLANWDEYSELPYLS